MNFNFYIYGTPNGYNQYPADTNSVALQEFAQNNSTESQLTVFRKGQLVYYAYIRNLKEKSNNFIGFCLVFNGVFCQNPQKLFSLFDSAFDDVLMKGELLKFEKGKCLYTVDKFIEKNSEFDRIKAFFKDKLERDFIHDFTVFSPLFKVGNGSKNISVRESVSEILAAIAEFDCVHITNNEKSLSELERTHKLLTDLYAEKHELDNKYRKLVAQKKQYKVVFVLLLAVIGCGIGLFAFNKNLQGKDSQIRALNNKINQQQTEFENINKNLVQLKVEKERLFTENSRLVIESSELTNEIKQITKEKERLSSEKEQFDKENDKLRYNVSNLETQNNSYRNENNNLSKINNNLNSEILNLKSQVPIWYQVTSTANYLYKYRCSEKYEQTKCYSSAGQTVKVYKIDGNYGLTEYGWTEMSNLRKN